MLSAAVEVALPHIDLYMVCQLPSKTATLNETAVSDELKEYFMSFNATSVSFSLFNTTIDGCVASDLVEVETSLDGTLEMEDDGTSLDAATLKDMVNEDDLVEYLEPLCKSIVFVDTVIQDAGSEPEEDGWAKWFSVAFCDLNSSSKVDLSVWAMFLIGALGLFLICFVVCCCCGGRRK